jgi:hypothetical protein
MVTEIPKYDKVKTRLCKERPKGLGNEQNTEDSAKIVFSKEVLRQADNSSFLRIDQTDDSAKRISVFAGEDCEYLLRNRAFFLEGTFKNCTIHVDLGSTSHENYIFSVMFALLPDKEGTIGHCLLTMLESCCSRSPKIIKVYFDTAVFSAVNKVFQAP